MRLFLAVHPEAQWRRELATRIDPIREQLTGCPSLRWVQPENWHLTLQFLGEWPEELIPTLEKTITGAAVGDSFLLKPGAVGAFPDMLRPRVLFVHMDSDGKAENLASTVRRAVAGTWADGPQDTKPFRPHLTVARVKGPLGKREREILAGLDLQGLPDIQVQEFRLVASVLRPEGAEHRDLRWFRLGTA